MDSNGRHSPCPNCAVAQSDLVVKRGKSSRLLLFVVTLVAYIVVFDAWRDYQVRQEIQSFFDAGPRFTAQDGLFLCERIRKIEIEQNITDPLSCSQLRKRMEDEEDQ